MKLIDNHTDKNGDRTETYVLDNGHSARYVVNKAGKRRLLDSSDPDFKEPKDKHGKPLIDAEAANVEAARQVIAEGQERLADKREQEIKDERHAKEETLKTLQGDTRLTGPKEAEKAAQKAVQADKSKTDTPNDFMDGKK